MRMRGSPDGAVVGRMTVVKGGLRVCTRDIAEVCKGLRERRAGVV